MQWKIYLSILPIGLGIMTFVGGLICLIGYFTSQESATKRMLYPWFARLSLAAFLLLSIGIFFTSRQF